MEYDKQIRYNDSQMERYAVIGIMDVYDAEALGLIDLEDED